MSKNTYDNPNNSKLPVESSQKRWTIYGIEFVYLLFIGIVIAFMGWIAENTVKLFSNGIIDARYHTLPFISPYVLIPFAFHILLGSTDDIRVFGKKIFKNTNTKTKILSNILVFITLCITVFLGELVVGNLYKKCFGISLWYYSRGPLLTPYAGLLPSLSYGFFAYVIFKFLYNPLLKAVRKAPYKVIKIIAITLGTLILADAIHLTVSIICFGKAPMLWRIKLW